jgi:hypothetical protein
LGLIPKKIDEKQKKVSSDFSRTRKLPFPRLIVFVLSLVTSGKSKGVDTKSRDFFTSARRSGLWPEAVAVHRSALTKARTKVPWEVFEELLHESTRLAYDVWPDDPRYTWHGMSVYAIDGSKYSLPATEALREAFDPESGLEHSGKGHYPQCLVSTAYDVFRRFPVARTVVGIPEACEREEAKALIQHLPSGQLLCFDQGYPSYEFIRYVNGAYEGKYIFRCPASSTFKAVEKFMESEKEEDIIWIDPSSKYLSKVDISEREDLKPIPLRIIKLRSPDGEVSVLLTNLFEMDEYPKEEIIGLYFRRWEVENYYRDEKVTLEVERFHSRTVNGIMQELMAAAVMSVLSRTLMVLADDDIEETEKSMPEPQFKNAIMTLASDLAVLVPEDPEKAIEIFVEIMAEIRRVKYYRPKTPRPSQPRVCKRPVNKWAQSKAKKLAMA